MVTLCVKCQILFSGKNKKNIISLSSAELAKKSGKGFSRVLILNMLIGGCPQSVQVVVYKSALYCYLGIFLTQCVASDVS